MRFQRKWVTKETKLIIKNEKDREMRQFFWEKLKIISSTLDRKVRGLSAIIFFVE